MTILVTGGTGYIGSHTVVELIANGDNVLILDNFSNSSTGVVQRVEAITGSKIQSIEGDIRDRDLLRRIFAEHDISAVIHFAGLKAVGESVAQPMKYYDNNVTGSLILVEEMLAANVFNLVFSSSATVYGVPASVPIDESMPVGNTSNPYGTSKLMVEHMLTDIAASEPRLSVVLLRYFNPVGAHASGTIGEHPNGAPNNLLPYVCQVAVGKLAQLCVFGDDYDTHDGTGVRDYIHVVDLAMGHIKAMASHLNQSGVHIYNLGTGNGYSVLDVVREFKAVTGVDVPYKIAPRRSGDVASCYADPSKAKNIGWAATRNLTQMIEDAWRWQSQNPNGYEVI